MVTRCIGIGVKEKKKDFIEFGYFGGKNYTHRKDRKREKCRYCGFADISEHDTFLEFEGCLIEREIEKGERNCPYKKERCKN